MIGNGVTVKSTKPSKGEAAHPLPSVRDTHEIRYFFAVDDVFGICAAGIISVLNPGVL